MCREEVLSSMYGRANPGLLPPSYEPEALAAMMMKWKEERAEVGKAKLLAVAQQTLHF